MQEPIEFLAHQTGQALLGHADSRLLELPDFSVQVPHPHLREIHEQTIIFVADKLKAIAGFEKANIDFCSLEKICADYKQLIGDTIENYLTDSLTKTIDQLPIDQKLHAYSTELKERFEYKNTFFRQNCIEQSNKALEDFYYATIADIRRNPRAIFERCLELSIDHPDLGKREAFKVLCNQNNGLPKGTQLNAEVANAKFDRAILETGHARERILIAELGTLDTTKTYIKNGVEQAVKYVQGSLKNGHIAPSYAYLAQEIKNALINGQDVTIFELPDFSVRLENAQQEVIKEQVAAFITDKLAQSKIDSRQLDHNHELIQKVNQSYKEMVNGNFLEQAYLEAALLPSLCEKALELDVQLFDMPKSVAEQKYVYSEIKRHAEICRDMDKNGAKATTETYISSSSLRLHELMKGHDPRNREQFTGNQREHFVYAHRMRIFEKEASLGLNQNLHPMLRSIFEFGMKFNRIADAAFQLQYKNLKVIITNLASANTIYSFVDRISAGARKFLPVLKTGSLKQSAM